MRLSELEANILPCQRIERTLFEHFWRGEDLSLPSDNGARIDQLTVLYSPETCQLDGLLLRHFGKKLAGIIKKDFPSVTRLEFLHNPRLDLVGGEALYTFRNLGILTLIQENWPSGFSEVNSGYAAVIVQKCHGLVEMVDTAIHEAAHVEFKKEGESCEIPNRLAAERTQLYLTRLFV